MWRLFVGHKDGQRNAEETGEFVDNLAMPSGPRP
jgi:hypothetical protein